MSVGLFIGLLAFGLFIGVMSGFFGVGGGAFLVPFLVRGLGLGWPAANGLSLAQMVPTSALGAWKRWRQGEVPIRLGLWSVVGSIPGAWFGQRVVKSLAKLPPTVIAGHSFDTINLALTVAFSGAVMFMGFRMIRPEKQGEPGAAPVSRNGAGTPAWKLLLLGLAVGTISSMLGIGGGFLFVPVAVERLGTPVASAVGASLFQMPITAATGAILYKKDVAIPYLYLIPLLMGSLSGVNVGVSLSRRFSNKQYRAILGWMFITISVVFLLTSGMRGR